MVFLIKKPSVRNSYEELVKLILKEGKEIITEDGQKCKELLNVCVEVTNPNLKGISPKYPLGKKAIENYINNLLYGKFENEFSYTYYNRINDFNGINQLEYVINKLKNNHNTRRAVINIWNPTIDTKKQHVPCLQHIGFNKIDDKLYMSVVFRSNDCFVAFHSNALGLIELGKIVAKETNSKLINYTHFIYNAHIYIDRDETEIKKYFK